MQPEVVKAALQVEINANTAKAAVKQAEGVRDSTKIRADGDAAAIRRVGEAQADAYHAQADVIGSDRVALVKVMEQVAAGKIKITPDTLLTSTTGELERSGRPFLGLPRHAPQPEVDQSLQTVRLEGGGRFPVGPQRGGAPCGTHLRRLPRIRARGT